MNLSTILPMSTITTNEIRRNLALAYRLIAHLGMDDVTYTHLSARAPGEQSFYIMSFGLLFSEVTASNLLKVDFDGNILEGSEEHYNKTGYVIHSAIYQAREDLNSIFHLHTHAGIAVSAQKDGLLPVSQFALHLYNQLGSYDYNSLELNPDNTKTLAQALADNKALLLRNHGTITCGATIHEAMFWTHHLEQACKVQCNLNGIAKQELLMPSIEVCKKANHDLTNFEKDLGKRDWNAWARLIEKHYPDYKT